MALETFHQHHQHLEDLSNVYCYICNKIKPRHILVYKTGPKIFDKREKLVITSVWY